MSEDRGHRAAGKEDAWQAGLGKRKAKQSYDLARTKLYNLLDGLRVVMSFGYPINFDHIYNKHRIANLALPAVSVDLDDADSLDSFGGATGRVDFYYDIGASLRVHVGYLGGMADSYNTTLLLSSINNYFAQRVDLGEGFKITSFDEVKPRLTFEDSGTLGGQMKLTLRVPADYLQA